MTVIAWWPAIEVLIVTGVSNAWTEAANTNIKHIKRTGRGYRNPTHDRARILLVSAARTAARTPWSTQCITSKCVEPDTEL